jgi:hypothetical protein
MTTPTANTALATRHETIPGNVTQESMTRLEAEIELIAEVIRHEVDVDLLKWKILSSTIRISFLFGFI